MATVTLREFIEPLMKEFRFEQGMIHLQAQQIAYREGLAWGATLDAADATYITSELRAKYTRQTAAHKARQAAYKARKR